MSDNYSKQQLVKHAKKLADEKHPEGWNKKQLIDASYEVFGGFARNPHKPIRTEEDIGHMQNSMAFIDGGYPLSMTDCEVIGISGNCGLDCIVLQRGECENEETFFEAFGVSCSEDLPWNRE